ncbi:phosphoglycerate mutase (2,3-diphosphoglycerate-independent) [Candidatus Dojkabacteria bacterium]|nr:phosphoglycerate mutase (2,3-diphosphoglycerate-independent) [Candidatus Dojkabacteria bacterium]
MGFIATPKTLILLILDGLGIAPPSSGNAIVQARTPNLDMIFTKYPYTELKASGKAVGLDEGIPGNGKVGHITIGAGKVIRPIEERIKNSIDSGTFYKNKYLINAFENADENSSNVHIITYIGDNNMYSSLEHLEALLKLAQKQNFNGNRIFIHAILEESKEEIERNIQSLQELDKITSKLHIGHLSTIIGRSFAMDEEEDFGNNLKAYNLYTQGVGEKVENWRELVKIYKQKKETAEKSQIGPYLIENYDDIFPTISRNDSLIFLNHRAEGLDKLAKLFLDKELEKPKRVLIKKLFAVSLVDYKCDCLPNIAFPNENIISNLFKQVSDRRLPQLKIAESERFIHITQYLNGNNNEIYPGEDRIEIKSKRNKKDYKNEYKFYVDKLESVLEKKIDKDYYNLITVNIANIDLAAHTGDFNNCVKAVEYIDEITGKIVNKVLEKNYALLISSSHGNAEQLVETDGDINTRHTNNPVPFVYIRKFIESKKLDIGTLADIAPTVLAIMGLEKPAEMFGKNLLK